MNLVSLAILPAVNLSNFLKFFKFPNFAKSLIVTHIIKQKRNHHIFLVVSLWYFSSMSLYLFWTGRIDRPSGRPLIIQLSPSVTWLM